MRCAQCKHPAPELGGGSWRLVQVHLLIFMSKPQSSVQQAHIMLQRHSPRLRRPSQLPRGTGQGGTRPWRAPPSSTEPFSLAQHNRSKQGGWVRLRGWQPRSPRRPSWSPGRGTQPCPPPSTQTISAGCPSGAYLQGQCLLRPHTLPAPGKAAGISEQRQSCFLCIISLNPSRDTQVWGSASCFHGGGTGLLNNTPDVTKGSLPQACAFSTLRPCRVAEGSLRLPQERCFQPCPPASPRRGLQLRHHTTPSRPGLAHCSLLIPTRSRFRLRDLLPALPTALLPQLLIRPPRREHEPLAPTGDEGWVQSLSPFLSSMLHFHPVLRSIIPAGSTVLSARFSLITLTLSPQAKYTCEKQSFLPGLDAEDRVSSLSRAFSVGGRAVHGRCSAASQPLPRTCQRDLQPSPRVTMPKDVSRFCQIPQEGSPMGRPRPRPAFCRKPLQLSNLSVRPPGADLHCCALNTILSFAFLSALQDQQSMSLEVSSP